MGISLLYFIIFHISSDSSIHHLSPLPIHLSIHLAWVHTVYSCFCVFVLAGISDWFSFIFEWRDLIWSMAAFHITAHQRAHTIQHQQQTSRHFKPTLPLCRYSSCAHNVRFNLCLKPIYPIGKTTIRQNGRWITDLTTNGPPIYGCVSLFMLPNGNAHEHSNK